MKTRWLSLVAAAALGLPGAALALDAPHDSSMSTGSCLSCHQLHNATGGSLTNRPAQYDLCRSCHNAVGKGPRVNWDVADQAVPGTSGDQHRWDAAAVSAAHGATLPLDPGMAARVTAGNISCSTCHDIHRANSVYSPDTVGSNFLLGVPTVASNNGASSVRLALQVATTPRPAARGYRVKIVAGNGIILSHDAGAGAAATWLNWSGSAWVAGVDNGTGKPIAAGMTLDDAAVTVTISGSTSVGDYWDFYVGYPFLRADNSAGAICLQCHADRNQSHYDVEGAAGHGWGVGSTPYSHPVGQSLNANVRGYDRGTPLDANGAVQGAGGADANPTNDLVLTGTSQQVSCVTCHSPHNADSNSFTVDP